MTQLLTLTFRYMYAATLLAFGVFHILFSQFVTGRAPAWPSGVGGENVFAWVTGVILICGALAVFVRKQERLALIVCGLMILLWAALRNIIQITFNPEYGALLTNTFKSFSLGFGAFVIADTVNADPLDEYSSKVVASFAKIGTVVIGLFLLIGGIQHFIFADFVKFLIPTWIPWPYFWTYFSGIALILAGTSLITGIQSYLAALLSGIMVLTWVLILHIPRALGDGSQNEWTAVLEALSFGCILVCIHLLKRTNFSRDRVAQTALD